MRTLVTRVALMATLILTACAPQAASPAAPTQGEPQRAENQVLNIAVRGLFGNPTPQSSGTLHHLYWPLYDNLTQIAGNYEVRPSVAERWSVSDDGLTWRFFIRRDMTWPTGEQLTARDVVFTLNTVRQQRWPQISNFEFLREARLIDDYTMEIVTTQPDMSVPAGGNFLWIIPQRYYTEVGFDQFVQRPMGSGPYELVSFQNADGIRYRKRPQPHAFRNPIATELVIRLITENSQIIAGLRTGEIDIAAEVGFTGEQVETARRAGLQMQTSLSTIAYYAFPQGSWELRNTPLRDRRVRLAMQYAVNREGLATTLFRGAAQPAAAVAVLGTPYNDPAIPVFPYNPAEARRLLAEAGYPNGFRLPGGMDYTTAFTLQDVVVALQADWRAIGVEFDVIANERAVFVDKAFGRNNLPKGDIWLARQSDATGFGGSRTFIGCGRPAGAPPAALLWCNPEWDRLMDQAYAERDLNRRTELLRQAVRIQVADAVYQAMYHEPLFTVHTDRIRNVTLEHPLYYRFDSAFRIR